MILLNLALATLAFLGHCISWIAINNRLHALAIPGPIRKAASLLSLLLIGLLPILYLTDTVNNPFKTGRAWTAFGEAQFGSIYLIYTWMMGCITLPWAVWHRYYLQLNPQLTSNRSVHIDIAQRLDSPPIGTARTRILSWIPANQIFHLSIHEKVLKIPRLPLQLDGLTIVHLSDLHFTGNIQKTYFNEVVREANALAGDIVAITGDLIDNPECMDWLPETLGHLNSRYGTYFIFGNHDVQIPDKDLLVDTLKQCGLNPIGGCWKIIKIGESHMVIAGNQLPWFQPAPSMEDCPSEQSGNRLFRLLLSHSPDQIHWAKQHDFDVMLAGHTHGGQIRFPVVGPITCPSRMGVKYASGVFFEPPTVMHVTRGISGVQPIRLNCPPELTKLTLRSEQR